MAHASFLVACVAAVVHCTLGVTSVTIDNMSPCYDNTGNIMDAHDGPIQRFSPEGPYYIHAVGYGLCVEPSGQGCDQTPDHCGFQLNHTINIWKSMTLENGTWEFVGQAVTVQQRPSGTVFRPDLVYNPNTGLYVLWWNWVAANGTYMGYAAATAPSPEGPFTVQEPVVPLLRNNATSHAGDYHLFVDDDGTGYVIYSAQFWMSVEQLRPDFLGTAGIASPLFQEYFVEAPVLFKRVGLYYALFGHCCCFCYQGSGILVHTATDPLGPWTVQPGGDLACMNASTATLDYSYALSGDNSHAQHVLHEGAIPTPGQGCLYNNPNQISATRAQQNYVAQVDTPDGVVYVWSGDRWQQSPDTLKGHDPQFWLPLVFNDDGSIQDVRWADNFTINVV